MGAGGGGMGGGGREIKTKDSCITAQAANNIQNVNKTYALNWSKDTQFEVVSENDPAKGSTWVP